MAKSITFILKDKKLIATKILANIRYDNVLGLPARTTILKDLGLQGYYYFTLNGANQQDTARLQTVADFAKALGVPVGVLYPLEVPEINTSFPKWLDTLKQILNPAFYGGGAETINVTHGTPITNAEYVSLIQQGIAHTPGIPWIWDAGLIQKEETARNLPNDSLARNLAIAAIPGAKRIRQYLQLSPEPGSCVFGTDQADNFRQIRNFYDVTFPDRQNKLVTRFPGCTIDETQWHDEDTGTKHLSIPLANYSKGEMVRSILSNTEIYSTLIWMAENNLITRTNTAEPEYTSIKRLVPAFKYKYVMPVTITLTGCRAVGFSDGVDSYAVLITNESSTEQTVSQSDIKIFGKTVPNSFKRDSGYADSWTAIQQNEIVNEPSIKIRKNSTNFITFSTAQVPT